jgi:hypothetical protein
MKIKTGQAILIGLPIAIGLYLIVREVTKKPKTKKQEDDVINDDVIIVDGGSGSGSGSRNDSFPLKKGSKGNNVRRLQTALKKINPSALPRYGVDGDFGNETEAELMIQTGKTTCTSAELTTLELKAARSSGTWFPPMADPNPVPYNPPFGF